MSKKRNLIFLSLLILSVLLLSSCFLNPTPTEGILKGRVIVPEGTLKSKDLTGQALPDATVNIIDLSTGAIIATTTSDSAGYYQISVPPGGPYLLEAVKGSVILEQITCQVEVGMEYDLRTADCVTTAAALIAQAMMDAGDNPADINCDTIIADPNFDDVSSLVCATIKAGVDPTTSAAVLQAIEDFLNPPTPTPTPTPAPTPTPTPVIATNSIIVNGALTPSVTVTGTNFKDGITISDITVEVGTTGLALDAVSHVSATEITITFTGTAAVGEITIQAKISAFDPASVSASNTLTVTVPAAVINIAAITGVTAPVTGAIPETMITKTAQYTGTVTWAPEDNLFVEGTVYTATITLTPETGYTLTGVPEGFFSVAGAVATNSIDSGEVTAIFLIVGASYGGGIIAYILEDGDPGYVAGEVHGLIAAAEDQSSAIRWLNDSDVETGAIGLAIGFGQANTAVIVAIQGTGSYAAKLCDDYSVTVGGVTYTDWFLPSKDELNQLYLNKDAIGGFEVGDYSIYWSSSEGDAADAWWQDFRDGLPYCYHKYSTAQVGAVQAF